ncbi:MAG TPA: carboxypeptidase regulatory-like domain-containing protein [Vicinamibacterales bacterium]|nr:carboxypeptidase regulatory-like domain-containing protein [Vicinamibacterales bacterium]
MRVFRGVLLCAGILAMTAGAAHAQALGSIFGKVTDPSGSILPGVTVTVSGPSLQRPLVATTTETGAYQFPSVPIGTYTVTFELASFRKAARQNVIVETGFNAQIDMKLAIGQVSEEVTVTAASPVVDTKKTTTGQVFTREIFESIPTARDPWQIIGMTPGVQAGLNVGGSSSGQQVGLSVYGTSGNVQWNREGGSITDLSSNSSPAYFNFDSFEQIQVVTGGGDVSVQSSGLSINLVTKSGSNIFKGTAVATFENDKTQSGNVSRQLFESGQGGFLSGNPIKEISNYSVEYGGPIKRNRLWWWAAADRQDINAGVINFFDAGAGGLCSELIAAQRQGSAALGAVATYDRLEDVQKCLSNDKTLIKNVEWKFNYQLNASNKFQYLFSSDNKYRNARGASATTLKEATTQQTSDKPWGFPLPQHLLTHTWILTDRLVFNNQFTYSHGGFFLDYQDVPPQGDCLQSRFIGNTNYDDYLTGSRANPACLFNVQSLSNRTTGFNARSLTSTYQTDRHSWEAKTDGTYFLTNMLGGDHSLKFGLGWRRHPIRTYSHYSGGARATLQCVGNLSANCGAGVPVAPGSASGFVVRQATLYRDNLLNNDWWTYNGYLQDSYSRGRWRINGGLRYDWQTSKYLGGCVANNPLRPDLLPSQCENGTDRSTVLDPVTGLLKVDANGVPITEKIPSFANFAPRVSVIYDLSGTGKTSVRASYSLYYQTKITLANSLGGLAEQTALTWGTNQNSGACSTTAGASCWLDNNLDGLIQASELIGTPSTSNARFDLNTGILRPAGNVVSPDTKIGRTREFITGLQHELIPNLAVGVEYIYRKYDRGTAGYTVGYQPGAPLFPLSQLYVGPLTYTDPVTGLSAPYWEICQGCQRPSGVASITMTSLNYNVYQGFVTTVNKRFSDRWMLNSSLTVQTNPGYTEHQVNPTGLEFQNGVSTLARYLFKLNGSYAAPWGINVAANWNVNDGATRTRTLNGPGSVYGGVNASGAATTLSGNQQPYNTLRIEAADATRLDLINLLDLGVHKVIALRGGKNRVKVMADLFNVFNIATIRGYSTDANNLSHASYNAPNSIVPPRVFRIGAQLSF